MKINNSNESLMNYTHTDTNLKYNLHIIGNGSRNVLKNYKVYFLFNLVPIIWSLIIFIGVIGKSS
jgi:hypothetical protein